MPVRLQAENISKFVAISLGDRLRISLGVFCGPGSHLIDFQK